MGIDGCIAWASIHAAGAAGAFAVPESVDRSQSLIIVNEQLRKLFGGEEAR